LLRSHEHDALFLEAVKGDRPYVQIFLEDDGVNLDAKQSSPYLAMPLSSAAANGHVEVVTMLLPDDRINERNLTMQFLHVMENKGLLILLLSNNQDDVNAFDGSIFKITLLHSNHFSTLLAPYSVGLC
jgi:hypothetical protein